MPFTNLSRFISLNQLTGENRDSWSHRNQWKIHTFVQMEEIKSRLRSAANEIIEIANSIAVLYQCIRANKIYTVYREPCTMYNIGYSMKCIKIDIKWEWYTKCLTKVSFISIHGLLSVLGKCVVFKTIFVVVVVVNGMQIRC